MSLREIECIFYRLRIMYREQIINNCHRKWKRTKRPDRKYDWSFGDPIVFVRLNQLLQYWFGNIQFGFESATFPVITCDVVIFSLALKNVFDLLSEDRRPCLRGIKISQKMIKLNIIVTLHLIVLLFSPSITFCATTTLRSLSYIMP